MRNRRKFYKERPHYIKPNNSESVGEVYGDRKIYINDENITFSLVYNKGVTSTNVGEFYREISTPIQVSREEDKGELVVADFFIGKDQFWWLVLLVVS